MSIFGFYFKLRAKQLARPKGFFGRLVAKKLNKGNRAEYDFIVQELSTYTGMSILEIGFANGVLLNRLANMFDNLYFGIDISRDMVKAAEHINRDFISAGNMKLFEADVEEMPFGDETFDIIYTANTVYFWRDVEKAIGEIKRVLKPGGKFINIALIKEGFERFPPAAHYGFSKYTLTELCDMLMSIGDDLKYKNVDRDNRFAFIITKEEP